MKDEFKPAIDRLRELADQNDALCTDLESGKITVTGYDKVDHLIHTYRYWYQCCLIAAWLLEKEK